MREWRSSVMSHHLKEEGLWKITAITVLSDHNHPKMKTSYCAGSSLFQDVKGHEVSEWFDELKMIVGTSQSQKHPGMILHMNNRLQQSSRNVENQCQDELKLFRLHLSFPNTKKYKFSSLLCTASSLRGWSKRTQIKEFKVKQITAGGVSSACEPLSSTPQIQEQKG